MTAVIPMILAAVALPWSSHENEDALVSWIGFACTAAILGGYSVFWPPIRNNLPSSGARLAVFFFVFLPVLLLPLLLGFLGQRVFVWSTVTYLTPFIAAGVIFSRGLRPCILLAGISGAVLTCPLAIMDSVVLMKDGQSGIDTLLMGGVYPPGLNKLIHWLVYIASSNIIICPLLGTLDPLAGKLSGIRFRSLEELEPAIDKAIAQKALDTVLGSLGSPLSIRLSQHPIASFLEWIMADGHADDHE